MNFDIPLAPLQKNTTQNQKILLEKVVCGTRNYSSEL